MESQGCALLATNWDGIEIIVTVAIVELCATFRLLKAHRWAVFLVIKMLR
jgi:hypothetical protein